MTRGFRTRVRVACLAAWILSPASRSVAQINGPENRPANELEWRFSLKQNQTAKSNIDVRNICFKRHRFQIELRDLPFMRLLDSPTFSVDPRNRYALPVEFNSTGLKAGEYEGAVLVRCMTCPREKGCTQDRQVLHVYMAVSAPEAEVPAKPELPATGTSQPSQDFLPGRVLVVIPLGSSQAMAEAAEKIAKRHHGLGTAEIHPLISIGAGLAAFAITDGTDVLAKVAELEADRITAQADFIYKTAAYDTDPYAQMQYGPKLIRADRLRGSVTGKGIKIAVIDTGLDGDQVALKGKVAGQTDVTGMGLTPDIHGTLVAGIIVSVPHNGSGISGVAPASALLAVKACQPQAPQAIQAQCWSLTLARGLDLAIQGGARIINLSLGGPQDRLVRRLVDEAVSRGIVVVGAAGNDGPRGQPSFPAALPNVVAVTAVDAQEQLYPEATQGDFIDLAAPGVEIVSTAPGNKLLVSSGTSLATAFVTATVALALERHPELSPQAVQALLEQTAKDLGPAGKDSQFGSGLVDACRAVAQLNGDRNLCR